MVFTQMVFTDAATLRRTFIALVIALMLALMTAALSRPASALTVNVIPITGQLLVGGAPVTGNYDLTFQLYSAVTGGATVGPLVTVTNVAVADGVFYAEVNFGALSLGNPLFVQTNYRVAGSGNYTILLPRHTVPSVVYAAYTPYASFAGNTNTITGHHINTIAPTNGQALVYNTGTSAWTPTTLPAPTAYTAGTGLALTGSQFAIPNGGVTASLLGTGSVTANAIAVPLNLTGASNGAVLQANNTSAAGYGLYATCSALDYAAVYGVNLANLDDGSLGTFVSINDTNYPAGVVGYDVNTNAGMGVYGTSNTGYGGYFTSGGPNGVYSVSTASDGNGLSGIANSGPSAYGVYGSSSSGYGGYFTSGGSVGLYGETTAIDSNGIVGIANNGTLAYGVYGASSSGYGGYFNGKVRVVGNLSVTGSITAGTKDFQIDDPLDPAGKYLSHACIESNEMSDIYSGNTVTDAQGNATVTMPNWFGALNKDFRYQLTCIGQFAQAIIGTKIHDNTFSIKTDKPNIEVSWQVTGVRQDAYANAHPLQVEEDKPVNEQGLFLHPTELGQSEAQGIGYQQQQAHRTHGLKHP